MKIGIIDVQGTFDICRLNLLHNFSFFNVMDNYIKIKNSKSMSCEN